MFKVNTLIIQIYPVFKLVQSSSLSEKRCGTLGVKVRHFKQIKLTNEFSPLVHYTINLSSKS